MPFLPLDKLTPEQMIEYNSNLLEGIVDSMTELSISVAKQLQQTEALRTLLADLTSHQQELQNTIDQLRADGQSNSDLVAQLQSELNVVKEDVTNAKAALDSDDHLDEPVTEPPVDENPVDENPVDENPPVTEPPVDENPPVTEPPVDEPEPENPEPVIPAPGT